MRLHVIGLGSIGHLLSFHLRRVLPKHHSITLIHKNQKQANETIYHGKIQIESQGVVSTARGFSSEIFRPTAQSIEGGAETIDTLFVTTKAYSTMSAISRLLPRLSPSSTIVLMHNGMGIYEELIHDIFRNPEQRPHFILSSNTHGAFRKNSAKLFVHAGIGNIHFGIVPDPAGHNFEAGLNDPNIPEGERRLRLSDLTPPETDPTYKRYVGLRDTVAALLLLEPLNVSWLPMSEVQTAMRRKLVANSIINPLTALMGCRNGDIFSTNAASRLTQRVCHEASEAFVAEFQAESKTWRHQVASQGEDVESIPIARFPRSLTATALEDEVRRVADVTKGNISSMLTDIRRGQHRTEIDYLNGYLLKLGTTYRVPMPATAALLNLVDALDAANRLALTTLVLLVDRSWQDAPIALWTFIATSAGLVLAAVILRTDLTLFQALQVSNLVWLANFGTFFALASYSRQKAASRKDKDTKRRAFDYKVKVAAMLQSLLSMALTLYMWGNARDFGPMSQCSHLVKYIFFVVGVQATSVGRIISLVITSLLSAVYAIITLKELLSYRENYGQSTRRSKPRATQSNLISLSSNNYPLLPSGDVGLFPSTTRSLPSRDTSISAVSAQFPLKNRSVIDKRRPKRRRWSSDLDPMLVGIVICQAMVFTYFIVSTELLLKSNPSNDNTSAQWSFGQILALIVVIPSGFSLASAISEHGVKRPSKRSRRRKDDPESAVAC
ncbi:hypothetical protein H0H93_004945 [Arthromyces matolae]|nr:hypothetical protein H0H93_004945 [Arthromyces matolae]